MKNRLARTSKTAALVCLAFGLLLVMNASHAQNPPGRNEIADATAAKKWQEDLRYLAQELPKRHRDLFHTMTREQFETAVKSLDERIPKLSREQMIVELQRIVAMIRDCNTMTVHSMPK